MRDVFGFNFSANEESKEAVGNEDTKFKGIQISSNGYYGYQLVQTKEKTVDDHNYEYMDVQCNDSDIQFNNFIQPEERLCSEPVAITVMRESMNSRKRPLSYDVMPECKKRREDDTIDIIKEVKAITKKPRIIISQPDHLTEDLLHQTHGCSIYHWQCDKEDNF